MTPEVLSPCGGPESLEAALRCGADAVYFGASRFSARKNAVNFSDDALKDAVRECHRHGVKAYVAINTVVTDAELSDAAALIELCCHAGADGIIIQDMAVYEIARKACPGLMLHASTQMTVHTPAGVDRAKKLGFKRVVAARELSVKKISELCGRGVEIEVFVHGALCMCVSGQCYLSAMIGGRSANRGLCAGACRLPFSAAGKPADKYALSLKDLSAGRLISDLADAGVASLKIEGRMKRPEYVAAATTAIKAYRDGGTVDTDALRAVFSRSGFTDGYLSGQRGSGMFGSRQKEDVEAAAEALPALRKLYEKPEKRFLLDMAFSAKRGLPMALTASDGAVTVTVSGDVPEGARTRQTTPGDVSEQLKKLGGTLYDPGVVSAEVEDGLSVPLSKINAMRREAVERLDSARSEPKPIPFDKSGLSFDFPLLLIKKTPELRIRAEYPEQLSKISLGGAETVVPIERAGDFAEAGIDPERAAVSLPRFDSDEEKTVRRLEFAKSLGYNEVECSNIGQIEAAERLGMTPVGGFGLNITNSLSARHYFAAGLKKLVLSPELKAAQCSGISCPAKLGAIAYGRLPLMIFTNCPIAAEVGCKSCRKRLTDRTGAEFPVLCKKEEGYFELLNSRVMWLADKLERFNLDFVDILLTDETPEEAARVVEAYRRGRESLSVGFTRGLYFRGVE